MGLNVKIPPVFIPPFDFTIEALRGLLETWVDGKLEDHPKGFQMGGTIFEIDNAKGFNLDGEMFDLVQPDEFIGIRIPDFSKIDSSEWILVSMTAECTSIMLMSSGVVRPHINTMRSRITISPDEEIKITRFGLPLTNEACSLLAEFIVRRSGDTHSFLGDDPNAVNAFVFVPAFQKIEDYESALQGYGLIPVYEGTRLCWL